MMKSGGKKESKSLLGGALLMGSKKEGCTCFWSLLIMMGNLYVVFELKPVTVNYFGLSF